MTWLPSVRVFPCDICIHRCRPSDACSKKIFLYDLLSTPYSILLTLPYWCFCIYVHVFTHLLPDQIFNKKIIKYMALLIYLIIYIITDIADNFLANIFWISSIVMHVIGDIDQFHKTPRSNIAQCFISTFLLEMNIFILWQRSIPEYSSNQTMNCNKKIKYKRSSVGGEEKEMIVYVEYGIKKGMEVEEFQHGCSNFNLYEKSCWIKTMIFFNFQTVSMCVCVCVFIFRLSLF